MYRPYCTAPNQSSEPLATYSLLPANPFLLEQCKPRLFVIGQSGGVIQSAGVQPESSRNSRLCRWSIAGTIAKPLADEVTHQAELDQLNLVRLAAVQFGKASRCAIDVQDMQLIPFIAQDGGKASSVIYGD